MGRLLLYLILCCGIVSDRAAYCGAGLVFESVSLLAQGGALLSKFSSFNRTFGNECFFLSRLCHRSAVYSFSQAIEGPSDAAYSAWVENKNALALIKPESICDENLLDFLTKRFLAKTTGFYPVLTDWVYPCFGIKVHIHPETSNTYARKPSDEPSKTYTKVVNQLKASQPHPRNYPLILTRPINILPYLPISEKFHLIDCPDGYSKWQSQKKEIEASDISPGQLLCIHRQKGVLRILPLDSHTPEITQAQYDYLLEWISTFGLTANRIELDRVFQKESEPEAVRSVNAACFLNRLSEFELSHPQKLLMLKATIKLIRGLVKPLICVHSKAEALVVERALNKIAHSFAYLRDEEKNLSLFDFISELELVHAHLSSLLEIISPYKAEDFSSIYRAHLEKIPLSLQYLTKGSVHSSGMISLSGIFKALPKSPTIIYGENTYFECIMAAERVGQAFSTQEADLKALKNVDLILGQFNPALKRIELSSREYRVEDIADTLRKTLLVRGNKPLTLAIDSTLDYLDSPRLANLLDEFQPYIVSGILNIVCYRSGHKYDLFGFDNYNGAPFFTIHNQSSHWDAFSHLHNDPVLQTDRLSLNWFCLSIEHARHELEAYRRQIFENTRAFLDRVPKRLLDKSSLFHIVPFEKTADAGFVDIKISGLNHRFRGACLAGGNLFLRCMENKEAIFYRPSLGFYHPNFTMLFAKEATTIRLTLGLDPCQIDLFVDIFRELDTLNGN